MKKNAEHPQSNIEEGKETIEDNLAKAMEGWYQSERRVKELEEENSQLKEEYNTLLNQLGETPEQVAINLMKIKKWKQQ